MKILIMNYEYPPLGGGGGTFTRDIAEELAKDHHVDVLTTHFSGLKKQETVNGVDITRVPVIRRTSLYSASVLSLLSFPIPAIVKGIFMMRKTKYDIIYSHFAVPTGPASTILSRLFGVPYVIDLHGGDIYGPNKKIPPHRYAPIRWTIRKVLNCSKKIIGHSQNTRKNVENIYKPNKKTDIIAYGLSKIDFELKTRENLQMQKDAIYLISIGRLLPRKGYDFLIKALGIVRKKGLNINLILIGDGPEHSSLKNLSDSLGLSNNVRFLSWLDEEKYQYLSVSDIFVLSSLFEPFGIVLIEAMFCGLPIIATNSGGPIDIIEDGKNGIIVPTANEKALANAIYELAKNNEKQKEIGIYNQSKAKEYDITTIVKKYVQLFNEVIRNDKLQRFK